MNGVLIIDKPAGLTSHDVVNRVRRLLHQRSVGHLGTLDPMATGVLPLVTGNLTRLAQFYTNSEKAYEGVIRFGFATDTYDADGEPGGPPQPVSLTLPQLEAAAARFRGVVEQIPPPFSAKKIQGVPAYKLARRQKDVVLKPVQVEVKEFEILGFGGGPAPSPACEVESSWQLEDRVRFRARVASGTYMRSVAHDLGQAIGCGAHLESLRRTTVAEFELAGAHTLEAIEAASGQGTVDTFFVHPRTLLPRFPCVTADEATAAAIRNGRPVNLPEFSRARQVKVFAGQKELIAIATRLAGTLFHPAIVLWAAEPCGAGVPTRLK